MYLFPYRIRGLDGLYRSTDFRQNLASHLDEVVKSRAPLLVTAAAARRSW